MCNVRLHSYHHFHYLLQVLNISGNNVPLFGRNHFARLGLTNLQRVAASRCGLVQIDGLAFIGLTNLVELDLSLNQLAEVNSIHYTMYMTFSVLIVYYIYLPHKQCPNPFTKHFIAKKCRVWNENSHLRENDSKISEMPFSRRHFINWRIQAPFLTDAKNKSSVNGLKWQ